MFFKTFHISKIITAEMISFCLEKDNTSYEKIYSFPLNLIFNYDRNYLFKKEV